MSNFKTYLHKGIIRNCPIYPEDSFRADHIYGLAIPLLQGDMKCRRNPNKTVTRVPLPIGISIHHKNVKLYFDFLI